MIELIDRRAIDLADVAERVVHRVRERVHDRRLPVARDDHAPAATGLAVPAIDPGEKDQAACEGKWNICDIGCWPARRRDESLMKPA